VEASFWAVVPPLLTIVLAVITKEVLLALFIGVFTGCMIMSAWYPFLAMEAMAGVIINSLTDHWNIQVLIIIIMLGGLFGLIVRSGGSAAFGKLIGSKIKTRKGAQGASWLLGIMIFFDDYFNVLTNGSVMRPLTDSYNVSRERLSYIIDSTAVGICLIVPLSSWVAFICSLIAESFASTGIQGDPFAVFISCIPYNYYAWLSLLMVILSTFSGLNIGLMAKAEKRAASTGVVCEKTFSGGNADEDEFSSIEQKSGKAVDMIAPIILLISLAVFFMFYTGGLLETYNFIEAFNNMDGMRALIYSISISIVFSMIFYSARRLSRVGESITAFITGAKSMLFVALLLTFAWSIGGICEELKTAEYLLSLLAGNLSGSIVPLLIFVVSIIITVATGATWGTYAIMIPLAVPLAVGMDANVLACITAVIGGGGCGANCSPLADTSILASASAKIRLIDHVKTQLPYSLTCAGIACVGYALSGFFGAGSSPFAPLAAVFVLLIGAVVAHDLRDSDIRKPGDGY